MILRGYIVPGRPHPLLAPEQNPHWAELRAGFDAVREEIKASGAELLLLYSTQWLSVIGHQIQADPEPEWVHVDQEWHALGSIPYKFRMDADYAKAYESAAKARGLHARTVAYHGFPIDTGTVTALKLLNPDNALPSCVVSCNMYADRAETLVLGKAAADALAATGKKTIAVAVTAFSNRLFTKPIEPKDDHIYAPKDDEWNRKILELLADGRLEDVSQLAREFSIQANGDQKMKALWWLAAAMGQHNRYEGKVFAYGPIWGSGGAVVGLTPATKAAAQREFDEDDTEVFHGDRGVLGAAGAAPTTGHRPPAPEAPKGAIHADAAPKPVGAYPHARREGGLLFLSGIGPRQAGTDEIPGGPVRNADGSPRDYDATAQTQAVIENIKTILEASGSSMDKVVDCQCFLINMARDFKAFNEVYASYFTSVQATRTTVEVRALPTPIAVEMKVIAKA